MAKLQRITQSEIYANAGESKQIHSLKETIEGLEAEIARLKASESNAANTAELKEKIQYLTQELTNSDGVAHIEFDRITRNPLQPRIMFPKSELTAFGNVLKEEGQLDPVILLRLTEELREQLEHFAKEGLFDPQQPHFFMDREFLLFDGERRWRSGSTVLHRLKAVVLPPQETIDLLEIQAKAASTTIHQKKLHDLEMAHVLISQIKFRFGDLTRYLEESLEEEIPRALNSAIYRLKQTKKNEDLTRYITEEKANQEEWLAGIEMKDLERAVLTVILSFQQNPSNISRNIFSLLKLPRDLKEAAWEEGLDPKKLRILSKLNSTNLGMTEEDAAIIRKDATRRTIAEKMSSTLLEQYVKGLLASYKPEQTAPVKLPKEFIALEASDLSHLMPDELRLCEKSLQNKMEQIRLLLSKLLEDE